MRISLLVSLEKCHADLQPRDCNLQDCGPRCGARSMHFPPEGARCRPCRHMLAPCPRITRCYHSTFDPCFIRLQPLSWASIGSLQPARPPCSVFPPLGLATGHVPRAPRLCYHAPAGPGSLPAEGPRGMGVSGGGAGGVLLAKRRLRRSGGSGWMPGSSIGRRAGAAGVSGVGAGLKHGLVAVRVFPHAPISFASLSTA